MDKNQKISQILVAKINSGMTVEEALNSIFGEGFYKELAGQLYDELRNKCQNVHNCEQV